MPPFALIIFDMDDTLVVSGLIWQRAEVRLYALFGQPFREDVSATYKGMNALDVGRAIHAALHPAGWTADEVGQKLRELLLEEFHGPVTPRPGADVLIRALHGHVPLAVASGSPPAAIAHVLNVCGWKDCFDFVLSSEGLPHGKPAPDVFLAVARLAACPPARALVIEDSLVGVRAATRAGMTCYVVPSSADPTISAEADRAFADLAEMVPVVLGILAS